MSINRFFVFTLFMAAVCAVGCFFSIHNAFLHWAVPSVVVILSVLNYLVVQCGLIDKRVGLPSFRELRREYRYSIIASELLLCVAVGAVLILPNHTVFFPGVICTFIVIPVATYLSGYFGVKSMPA